MIKLSKVRDALYDVSMETSCYFNTKTNEILWHFGFDENDDVVANKQGKKKFKSKTPNKKKKKSNRY